MAKRDTTNIGLSGDTIIEVISTNSDEVVKKEMTLNEWHTMKKQVGYIYTAFQLGFSQFTYPGPDNTELRD
jgi:hypothetical protein